MKLIITSFISLFITINSLANSTATITASVLDHKTSGCPTNSLCHKSFGEKRQAWIKTLKNSKSLLQSFKKTKGFPLNFWTKVTEKEKEATAYWHGQCFSHQSKEVSLMIGEKFAKNFKELNLNSDEYIPRLLIQFGTKIVSYPTIPFDSPIGIKNGDIIFNRDIDGEYFSYSFTSSDEISASHSVFKPSNMPANIKCPKELEEGFAKLKIPKGLYESSYCKALWDEDKKRYRPIIMGWSCN